ncbi:C40 family peptidase [Comamonas flocculans]|uniref:NlpC/P60 family protein n=1 Tax=Comamonas flocculans TaxID=2597701 RepID=A0A5B8RYI7_9BURK|nr:C40 family peptidase [Comamonas flocculans]QEA12887.1 NlpC/P60 family protein [Comamonas flocculans]
MLRRSFLTCSFAGLLAACGAPSLAPPGAEWDTLSPPPPSRITDEEASDIAIHALGLVGTPYRYGGNTPEGGFDCSGLIGYVYGKSATGMRPPRTVAGLSGYGAPLGRAGLRSGDLVLFGGGRPTHAGIYVGQGRFVHAPSTGGTVRLDRLDGPYWSRQLTSYRRP